MAQQDNPFLTVTLTGAPPVRIKKEDWPVIASAEDKRFDGEVEYRADRKATWKLTVRQNKDGRTLVYAVHQYETCFKSEASRGVRAGQLITVPNATDESIGDAEPIITAIQQVGAEIESRLPDDDGYGAGVFPRLVHECIADLPAVEI